MKERYAEPRKAVHEYRIPPQSPPGVQVENCACEDENQRRPHFYNDTTSGVELGRLFCNGVEGFEVHSDGSVTFGIAEGGFAPVTVAAEVVSRYFPTTGDYYVVYADGYKSISPAKAFEEGYTRL